MLLAIDVGNSSSVFALFDTQGAIHRSWRIDSYDLKTFNPYQGVDFDALIIGSVVPDVTQALMACAPIQPIIVSHDMLDIPILLDKPQEVGADRLVNAIAAQAKCDVPAIVIDFGTATTFDVINLQGAYCGGVIAPGVNLSIETLYKAAAQLPLIELKKPGKICGTSTEEAIQSGLYWGYIAMVEGLVERLSLEMNAKPTVIATGGLAHLFAENTKVIQHVDEELTLQGLYRIYQMHLHKD